MMPWDRLKELAARALPNQIDYTTPQLPADAPPLERLAALAADVGATGLEALQAPVGGVQSAYGNVMAPLMARSPLLSEGGRAELERVIAAGGTGREKFEAAQAANLFQSGIGDLATDVVSDPLSYIGLGLPGKAKAALPQAPAAVARTLQFLDDIERGTGKATEAVVMSPFNAAKWLGTHGPLAELGKQSPQSAAAMIMRDLQDATAHVRAQGGDLQLDIDDWATATQPEGKLIPDWPGTTVAARRQISRLEERYRQAIRAIPDPASRAAAQVLKGQSDQVMDNAWEQAFLTREGVRGRYGDAALSAETATTPDLQRGFQEVTRAFREAYEGAATIVQAGRHTAEQLAAREVDAAADPALMPQLESALRDMTRTVASYRPVIRDMPPEERLVYVGQRNAELRDIAERVRNLSPMPEDLEGLLTSRQAQLRNLADGVPGILAEVPTRFEGQREALERVLEAARDIPRRHRRNGTEVPQGDDLWNEALDTVGRQLRRELGVNQPSALAQAVPGQARPLVRGAEGLWGMLTGLYKESALGRLGYGVGNLTGALANNQLEGVRNGPVLRELPENMWRSLRGEPIIGRNARHLAEITGAPIPPGLHSDVGIAAELTAAGEWANRAKPASLASERVGKLPLAGAFGALGAVAGAGKAALGGEDENASLKNALVGAGAGAAFGATMPARSRIFLGIAAAVEAAAREAGWTQRLVEGVHGAREDLGRQVIQTLAEKVPTLVPGPNGVGRVVEMRQQLRSGQIQQALGELTDLWERQGGMFSPGDLQGVLIKNGLDIDKARDLGVWWRNRVDEASRAGLEQANTAQFDYQNLTNFEQVMRDVVPFSTWALKAYPFFARHLAERPALAIGIRELNEQTEELRKQEGLTGRFTGSFPIGAGDALFTALMGRDVDAYWNPLRALTPFGDVGRSVAATQYEGEESQPFGKALALWESILPGPHPFIKAGARAAGLLGGNAPAEGLIPGTAPLKALTGIDLNAPQTNLERGIRQAFGQHPVDTQTALINKRIDELAIGQTGHSTGEKLAAIAPYQQAKTDRTGPIYEQAKAEVEREQGVRSGASWALGPLAPQAVLPAEEADIRAARRSPELGGQYAQLERTAGDEVRRLVDAGAGTQPASPRVMKAAADQAEAIFGEDLPAPVAQRLALGTNAAIHSLSGELYRLQAAAEPRIGAYGTFAETTEEGQLRNRLQQYRNPSAVLADDPVFLQYGPAVQDQVTQLVQQYQGAAPERQQALRKGNRVLDRTLTQLKARQDVMRKNDRLLDDYLNYETKTRGAGSIEDFFRAR